MVFEKVKVGVIGCGMISEIYMKNLQNTFSITELYACADMVDSKAQERSEQFGIKKMTVEEMLADKDIELIANLTYASSHYEITKKILEAGKHCYSEKMLADNMDEANELYELAASKGLMLACAPDTFLGSALQTARYVIDRGLIGTPIMGSVFLATAYQLIKTDENDAVRKFSVMHRGGGVPYDMGGYYLHAMFNMFGCIKNVTGICKTRNKVRPYLNPRHNKFDDDFVLDTENFLCSTLEFENGFCATLAITSDAGVPNLGFTIIGTEGTLFVPDPNQFGEKVYISRKFEEKNEFPFCFPYTEDSRGIGMADMAWALRTGRKARICPEMGCHTLEVIKGIISSYETGERYATKYRFERPAPLATGVLWNGAEERNIYLYEE